MFFISFFDALELLKAGCPRNIEDGKACSLLSFDHSLVFMTGE